MISYLKRQGLYDVFNGLGKESYKYENEWINDGDIYFVTIGMTFWDLLACATLLILLNIQRIFGKNWIEPLESTMRIFIAIWGAHSEPQEFFIQNSRPLLSLMKLFKFKKKQNLPHSQFELKKVSLE